MQEYRNWPEDFPIVEPSTDFDVAFVELFDQMVAADVAVYVDGTWSLIGFARGSRGIEFIRRGRLRHDGGQCWEVWPYDGEHSIRLGAQFGLSEHACIVMDGVAGIRAAAECWIEGNDTSKLVRCAEFWDKSDGSKSLEVQT